jgi:CHAT domain-containing protein
MRPRTLYCRSRDVRWALMSVVASVLFLICLNRTAVAQKTSPNFGEQASVPNTLSLHRPIGRTLEPGEQHSYQVALAAGQYARLEVEQHGIELVLEVLEPDQGLLAKFNDQMRPTGEQQIFIVANTAGNYTVRIKASLKGMPAGSYSIRVDEIRSAGEDDRALFEARKLQTQALSLHAAGKYDEELPPSERAVAITEKVSSASPAYLAGLIRDLGAVYWVKQNPKAKALFERSVAMFEQALGPEDPQTAYTESWLGIVYRVDGDYDKAEQILRRDLAILEKEVGPNHPWVVNTLRSQGILYDARGDFDNAMETTQRALGIAAKTVGEDSLVYSQLENNVGLVFLEKHEYTRAGPHLERGLAIQEKLFGPDYPPIAIILQNLGIVAREAKNYPLAHQYYDRALAIRVKNLGPESRDVAGTLVNIANLYHSEGDDTKCLQTHLRALKIVEKTASPSEALTIISLGNVAKTYAALGDLPNAVLYQARTDAAIEQAIAANVVIGSERQKLLFLHGDISNRTDRTVSLSLHLAPKNPQASSLAALVLLQRKGRVLDAMTDSFGKLRQRADVGDQALLDELKNTTTQLAQLVLYSPGKTPAEELQKRVKELENRKEDLEAEISRHSLQFRAQSQPVTLESVQAAIPENTALLEFTAYKPFDPKSISTSTNYGEPRYAVFVIRRTGAPHAVDLGEAKAIQKALEKFRETLRDPLNGDVRESSRELDAMLLQPVRGLLGDATQLLISPDGDLNLIPFQALLDEQGHYLLQRYSIGYLTAGRDLLRMQISPASKKAPLVMADPAFGEPPTTEITRAGQTPPLAVARMRRSVTTAKDLSGVYFAPLGGTALEARAIHNLFPEAQVLTGTQAAKDILKQVDAPGILHIATHGFFLQEATEGTTSPPGTAATKDAHQKEDAASLQNPLLRSGLALAGANVNKTAADNGILTALEASDLNLWGTKLVTLSACDTGVGEVKNGEGVYGLRRAFILAGTESLVMSLWPVSDYVTRQLMTQYYTGLKNGLGRGEALRRAQLAMLNRKDRQHPFYWASFIQVGEWGNLEGKR